MAEQPKTKGPGARIISIGGGKGGVGKSVLASNIAVTMAQMGNRVVLADLDLGAANQHLLLGVSRPNPGISTLLDATGKVEDALSETKIPNLTLLAGAGGSVSLANVTHAEKLRIIRRLKSLPADIVLVDVGAGIGYNAVDFFELGSQRLVVATPQVTSIHDAYAFLKSAVLRTLRHHAERSSDVALLEPASTSKEGEKVSELLARIKEKDPAFHEKVQRILKHFGAYFIGNQVNDSNQVGVFHAVSKMVSDYLGIDVPILGWIRSSPRLADSVNDRTPLVGRASQYNSEEAKVFRTIVETLLAGDTAPEEELLQDLEDVVGDEIFDDAPPAPNHPTLKPDDLSALSTPAPAAAAGPPKPPPRPAAAPPPIPVSAPVAGLPSLAAGEAGPGLAHIKPRVYVRPPRKRSPEAEDKKRKKAESQLARGRKKLTLPGMPPARGGT